MPARSTRGLERTRAALRARRADLLAVAAYGACTVLFFWRVVALGLVPAGYDLLVYFYPYKAFVAESLRSGHLPLWNPLVYMGVPLLPNIQIGVLYPPNALFYLLPPVDGLRWSIVLHTFLAGVFTYLFARASLGLSPSGAWLAGALFAFGGFIGGRVGHLNVLHSAVWLPALLLCVDQSVSRRSPRVAALGSVVYATQILAGHTQEVYYSGLVMGLYALHRTAFGPLAGQARLWPLGAVALMAAGAAALAGVQLLPALELARESYRSGGVPYSQATTYSVPLRQILESLLPLYSRVPYVEVTGFVAVSSLPLVAAALAWGGRRARLWFFAALATLALLLALGDSTPLYGWLHRWVPGFDLFRAPGRWLLLFDLSLALLAGAALGPPDSRRDPAAPGRGLGGYGMALVGGAATLAVLRVGLGDQDLDLEHLSPGTALTWGLFLLAAIALSLLAFSLPRFLALSPHRRWPQDGLSTAGKAALIALVLLELHLARGPMEHNRPVDPSLYTAPPPLVAALDADRSYRMLSLAGEDYDLPDGAQRRSSVASPMSGDEMETYLRFTRLKRVLPPDLGMVHGVSSLDGSDGGMLPTRRWVELKRALLGSQGRQPDLTMRDEASGVPSSRTLGGLGVRYLVVQRGTAHDGGWREVEAAAGGPLALLRNDFALPRTFLVHEALVLPDDARALEAVAAVDLARVAVLSEEVGFRRPVEPGTDRVSLAADGPEEVVVDVSLEQPGFLVLSDSYYPGWRAYVDGQETRLLRANYAVRAVALESGSHRVRFAYEPLSLKLGLGVTVLGLVAMGALLLRGRRVLFS